MDNEREPELHLFLEEDSEAAKWRRRTLFLLAVVLEGVFILSLAPLSRWLQRHEQLVRLEAASEQAPEHTTFLVMPPDLEKELRAPKTPIISNKNRLARGASPVIKPNGLPMPYLRGNTHLPKLAGGSPPPPPKRMIPPAAPARSAPPKTARETPPPKPQPPPPQPKQKIMLSDVTPPPRSNPQLEARLGLATPGEALQQSVQEAARGRSAGAIPGPGYSVNQLNNVNPNFSIPGPIILSNTRGVDFGPYLAEILMIVKQNWYAVIPEAARLGEQGRVSIVFDIQKDGSVPRLELVSSSGKRALDLAAVAGIRASIPFPPLPSQFTGNHLLLQFNFFYNMNP
jgi:TonB family protein